MKISINIKAFIGNTIERTIRLGANNMNLVIYYLIDTYEKLILQFHLSGNWKTFSEFRIQMNSKRVWDAVLVNDTGKSMSTWTIVKGDMRFIYRVNRVDAYLGRNNSKSNVKFVGVRYNANVEKSS